jgi:hypothetical protein
MTMRSGCISQSRGVIVTSSKRKNTSRALVDRSKGSDYDDDDDDDDDDDNIGNQAASKRK